MGSIALTKLEGKELLESMEVFMNFSYDQIKILKEKSEMFEHSAFVANQDRMGALEVALQET